MVCGSTKFGIVLLLLATLLLRVTATAQAAIHVSGTVLDPAGHPVPGANVEFDTSAGGHVSGKTAGDGTFALALPSPGSYTVRVEAADFAALTRRMTLDANSDEVTLRLENLAAAVQEVIVSGDVSAITLTDPDPSQRVMVREELLDANPGRPGAPVSLPGLPIESASGGIKAPQYFVPGVAGDHGEPIAQYIAVGGFLLPNNLSANAHGNGYADPNIYISAALGSVDTDGGAFNVLEGNHSLNLAATYVTRPQLSRFVTLTGDYRDMDLTAGFAPSNPATKAWIALEANYGNGLMETLEHRQQYKWNTQWIINRAAHEISLLSIGYWGKSHEGNLVPVGLGLLVRDTIDPRQQDQTHTGILAANDQWKLGNRDQMNLSGFFRTYNLALLSNFGEGLIRQSEFRTVEGGEAQETHRFSAAIEAMAGLDYNEDDIHHDNLDHYLSDDPQIYGPFVKVLSNNITIREVAPNVAMHANLSRHLQLYGGLRHEWIQLKNDDVLKPEVSSSQCQSFESPKATLTWSPGTGPSHWLPAASFSIGQGFFTEDPRISVAASSATASAIERSHSEQLVLEKEFRMTDVRVTLGQTTTTATLAKIDPDNGLAEDEGPGRLKYLTASARHQFSFGMVQAVFSKADARDEDSGLPAPEAPRTIFDALTTLDRLPLGLHARGEYEYVGQKLLDVGNPQHPDQYEAIPVGETRLALIRTFINGRLQVGANGMIARGYSGQTTETFAPGWEPGDPPPACASGVDGVANNFDCGTNERSVGIRMVSWIGGSVSWRFGHER